GSVSRFKRVCQITGRARGCYRLFGLCRHEIKRMMAKSLLFGVRLSSW
ncbi:MAG: 30S ribosomal protein S14, partial [bacterium]|nr:30S ribosomal protein S14 [bacterium]